MIARQSVPPAVDVVWWEWLAGVYVWKRGCVGRVLFLSRDALGENSIRGGDEAEGKSGVFHASASVSRWEKGRNG